MKHFIIAKSAIGQQCFSSPESLRGNARAGVWNRESPLHSWKSKSRANMEEAKRWWVLPRRPRGTGHQSQGSLLPGLHSTAVDGTGKARQRPDDLCPETWHTWAHKQLHWWQSEILDLSIPGDIKDTSVCALLCLWCISGKGNFKNSVFSPCERLVRPLDSNLPPARRLWHLWGG